MLKEVALTSDSRRESKKCPLGKFILALESLPDALLWHQCEALGSELPVSQAHTGFTLSAPAELPPAPTRSRAGAITEALCQSFYLGKQ